VQIGAFALAQDGHAELRTSARVIGIAFETLSAALVELHLAASAPRAEEGVKRTGVGFAAVRLGQREDGHQSDGGQDSKATCADNTHLVPTHSLDSSISKPTVLLSESVRNTATANVREMPDVEVTPFGPIGGSHTGVGETHRRSYEQHQWRHAPYYSPKAQTI
jgi:hypothetical protein